MKKGIIIGIAIIIIGVIAVASSQNTSDDASQNTSDDTNEVIIEQSDNNEPNQFIVELTDGVGFSETP